MVPAPHDLRTTLGAAPLRRDVVRATGPDAVDFLQGQLSQDVTTLGIGESVPSLLLQPNGKVVAWLRVTRIGDGDLALDVAAGHGHAVHERLRRFRLRTKVELEETTWSGLAVRGPGASDVAAPAGLHALSAAWPGVDGIDLLGEGELALAGVPLVDPEALEALRIESGVPAMGAELSDATIPAEAGRWVIDVSVSFDKGCYTGQELVARVDSRGGNVPHPVRGLLVHGEPVPVGAAIATSSGPAGTVTSSARSPVLGAVAMGVVSRTAPIGETVDLTWGGGGVEATIAELPLR